MHKSLSIPLNSDIIIKKKKRIKRELLETGGRVPVRIAILGGSTTSEIKNVLELFLLDKGIAPTFYESEYNKWYEDAVFPNAALEDFQPQIIYVHTSYVNLLEFPHVGESAEQVDALLSKTYEQYETVWEKLRERYHCVVIQNNFELPPVRMYGNLDFTKPDGRVRFVQALNERFAAYAVSHDSFYINDINYLAASYGLERWHDRNYYHLYKFAFTYDAVPLFSYNLASLLTTILGKSKKCLVLDLDNTLWGGVIGDEGADGIQLGHETAVAEGYLEFQRYVATLRERGVILAICSKNDTDIATSGFAHPDSVLKVADFAAFYTNWEPKHLNLLKIAQEINIGVDSLVFIDDNPVERQIVRDNLPDVVVPEVEGGNPASYIRAIEEGRYFETVNVSMDDLKRNATYAANKQRTALEAQFVSYDDFLRSLEMTAEIKPFSSVYLDRITQLTNKTNQFNLTTRRYTRAEIESISADERFITLYGRLADKFGDNGLVSVMIGEIGGDKLHVRLWLMSCRVLKRDFEYAMFDQLMQEVMRRGLTKVVGYYYKTAKNAMVQDLYKDLGFRQVSITNDDTQWELATACYKCRKQIHMRINEV